MYISLRSSHSSHYDLIVLCVYKIKYFKRDTHGRQDMTGGNIKYVLSYLAAFISASSFLFAVNVLPLAVIQAGPDVSLSLC